MEFRVVQVLWGALYTSVSPFLIGGLPKKDFVVGKCLILCLITYIVPLSGFKGQHKPETHEGAGFGVPGFVGCLAWSVGSVLLPHRTLKPGP